MIAACNLKHPARVRKRTFLHILDPGAVHAQRYMVFGLAGHGAGMATDALPVIDDEAVLHSWSFVPGMRFPHTGCRSRQGYVC